MGEQPAPPRDGDGDAAPPPVAGPDEPPGLDLDVIAASSPLPLPTEFPPVEALAGVSRRSGASPQRRSRPPAWSGRDLAIGVGLFALAVVLPLFRQQGTRSWQALTSEDGPIYAGQAIRHGGPAVLLRGYAGYLQLPPRLLGAIAPLVPLRDLPWYAALVGTTVGALLGWFVYWATKGWISGRPTRLVLASFLVIMPALGAENTANIVNTIWVFAAAAPWALISYQERPRDVGIRSVVAFVAAAATPLCVLFVPLAVVWVLVRRTRGALAVALSLVAGLALQGSVVLAARDTAEAALPNSATQLLQAMGSRVFAVFLVGAKGVDALSGAPSPALYIGAPVLVGLLFVTAMVGVPRRNQAMAATFLTMAVAMFVLPVWGRGSSLVDPGTFGLQPSLQIGVSLRYSVVPIIFLASAFALLLAPPEPRAAGSTRRARGSRGSGRQVARVVFAVQVSLLAVLGFAVTSYHSAGFDWPSSVDRSYQHDCGGEPSDRVVKVLTSDNPGYAVALTCRDLAS